MRISESSQAGELNFLNMTTSLEHHNILSKKKIQSNSSSSSYCTNERSRYIHRCPFAHCPHQNSQQLGHHHDILNTSTHDENTSLGVKISLEAFNHSTSTSSSCSPTTLENWASLKKSDGLRQGRFIARGATKPFITSQDRQKAISYM